MSKNLLSIGVLLISCIAQSQTTIKPGIGVNFTDFSKNGDGEVKGQAGWQIGGSVAFGKKFYIEPGLFYVGKSTEYTTTIPNPEEFKASINGFRIPVALGLHALGNEKSFAVLRIFGGPSAFIITSVGDDVDKDDIKKTNWGLFAGAGVDFWKIYVDLSYEWSLTNIQEDISMVDFGKARSLFLTAGLRINL